MEFIMQDKFNPYEAQVKGLNIFDAASLTETEELSAGLSEEEVLDYFAVTQAQLDASPADAAIFRAAFRRGRSIAKSNACVLLFRSMSERGGANASLAYLKQFGEMWPTAELEVGMNKNFSFQVVLDKAPD
jgi:hypothetical protein